MRQPRITIGGLALAGVIRQPARYAGLALLLVVTTLVTSVAATLGSYAGGSVTDQQASSLRTLTVLPDTGRLSPAVLEKIRSMPGVERAEAAMSVQVGLRDTGSSITLFALNPLTQPPLVAGGPVGALAPDEIVVPQTADGRPLDGLLGREVTLTYTVAVTENSGTTRDRAFRVRALADPTYQVDAPLAAYAALDTTVELAASRLGVTPTELLRDQGYNRVVVMARSALDHDALLTELQGQGYQVVSKRQEVAEIPGVISLIRAVSTVMFVGLLALATVAATTLTHAACQRRTPEIAILKAYGWPTARVRALFVGEVGLVIVVSVLVGLLPILVAGSPLVTALRSVLLPASGLGPAQVPTGWLALGGGAAVLVLLVAVVVAVGRSARRPVFEILELN